MADGDYMSVWEFSRLTVDEQCDVWAAVELGRVSFVKYSNVRCYHRAQVLAVLAREQPPVAASPRLDSLARPDLAHVKGDLGRGEVLAVDELLDTLTAHAEHAADLCRPD